MNRLVPSREEIEAYLSSRRQFTIELLCRAIAIKSTVGCEHKIQEFFAEYLTSRGFAPDYAPVDEYIINDEDYTFVPNHVSYVGRPNIIVGIPGTGGGRSAVINSHSDVVPGSEDIFSARHQDDIVYGRGACDAKGQIITMLLAIEALKELGVKLKGDLQLQIVIEEEAGGNGSLSVIRQGHKADCAVILEPTSLHMHPANRGAVWYKLGVGGKSAHMGKYWQGVNAIKEMAGLIEILREYETQLREDSKDNPLFPHDPSPVNVNIGKIWGGDWPATVAQECFIEGGIAFLPNRQIKRIFDEVKALIDAKASDWTKEHYSLEFGKLHNEAFETPVDHPSVVAFDNAVSAVLGKQQLTGWIASCDARLFARRGGMPTITFGPGDLGHAHSQNEQIKVVDILRAAEVLALFIIDWCGAD